MTPLQIDADVLLASRSDARHLDRARVRGELERIEFGAYVPVLDEERPAWEIAERRHRARCVAALDRLSEATVLSHLSAAAVHGLWGPVRNETVHVTQTFASNGRDVGTPLVRHQRPLSPDDVVVKDGFRVTELARTVIDCVCMLPCDWGFAVADSALRQLTRAERTDGPAVAAKARHIRHAWLNHLEQRGPRRGRRRAREILARADPLSESSGESRLRCLAVAAGLPTPQVQMPIGAEGHIYYADFGWAVTTAKGAIPALVEFDGRGKYEVPGAREAEKFREDAIVSTGARLVRFCGTDLLNENQHLVLPRLFDLVPELVADRVPVLHLNPQPRRARRSPRP